MNSIRHSLFLCSLFLYASLSAGTVQQVADGFWQAELEREEVTVYLYHRLVASDAESRFWRALARDDEDCRGLQAIYRSILRQGSDVGLQYTDEVYAFMEAAGVHDARETLHLARESLQRRGIDQARLEKLLAGYRGGVTGFFPCEGHHVVFATKKPIETPYELLEGDAPDADAFDNVLMAYSAWTVGSHGVEHRGIFRNLHHLVNPDRRYGGLALPLHAFGAAVERELYAVDYLSVKPLGYMGYLLLSHFADASIYGNDHVACFQAAFAESGEFRASFDEARLLMLEDEPVNLEALRTATIEQERLILDLSELVAHFERL